MVVAPRLSPVLPSGITGPGLGAVRPQDFTGGEATEALRLGSLGFGPEGPSRNPPWHEVEPLVGLDPNAVPCK